MERSTSGKRLPQKRGHNLAVSVHISRSWQQAATPPSSVSSTSFCHAQISPVRARSDCRAVPACSLSKYGLRASGVRTSASADRAETGFLPRFLRSVLERPSQEVRRELASGERFPAVSASCQSTGPRRNPQETCHSARRLVRRRARLVWELAEGVHPDSNGRRPVAWRRASAANSVRAVTALPQAALADRASSRGRLGERRERHLRCAVQDLQQRLRGSRRQALALLPVPHRVQWHTDPCGKGSLR